MLQLIDAHKYQSPVFQNERFMQDPVIVDLLDYWERLRDGRVAPMRSELDPREITDALDHTFMLERTNSGSIRHRLAGNTLSQLMGMELRGMPAHSMIEPEHRAYFAEIMQELFESPKIIELDMIASNGTSKARMLLLPMQDDSGVINRVLGCTTTQASPELAPVRFAILDVKTTRIVATRETQVKPMLAGFAEPEVPFEPARTQASKPQSSKPNLVSIEGSAKAPAHKLKRTNSKLKLVKNDD